MSDLTPQIREYARWLDERYPDVTFEELMDRLEPREGRPSWQWNGLLVALAAAVLVVLLGLLPFLVFLLSNQHTAPVVDRPTPPPTAPSTTIPNREGEAAPHRTQSSPALQVEGLEPAEVRTVETSLGTWTTLRYDGEVPDMETLFGPFSGAAVVETLPDLPNPGLQEADWHEPSTYGSAVVGQTAVSTASIAITFDWEALDPRLPMGPPRWVEGERALAFGHDDDPTLDVDLVAGVVEFRRRDTGELVLSLVPPDASITAQQLIGEGSTVASGRWTPEIWGLYVDNGETSDWVEPPWSGRAIDSVDVTALGDQFVLVASVRPDWEDEDRTPAIHTWRSTDGITWTQSGIPFEVAGFDRGSCSSPPGHCMGLDVEGDGDILSLRLLGDFGARFFVSADGAVWDEVELRIDGVIAAGPTRVSFGWMMLVEGDQMSCHVYISRDLRSWESFQLAPPFDPPGGGSSSCAMDGDHAIAHAAGTDTGSYWIGGFGG